MGVSQARVSFSLMMKCPNLPASVGYSSIIIKVPLYDTALVQHCLLTLREMSGCNICVVGFNNIIPRRIVGKWMHKHHLDVDE